METDPIYDVEAGHCSKVWFRTEGWSLNILARALAALSC